MITTVIGGVNSVSREIASPWGIALDGAGNVITVDYAAGYPRIVRINPSTRAISVVAGSAPLGGGDGDLAGYAVLEWPSGVAVNAGGDVFIGGSLRVRKITARTGVITNYAGIANNGSYGGVADGLPARTR
jgi:hypothetical protein